MALSQAFPGHCHRLRACAILARRRAASIPSCHRGFRKRL